MINPAIILWSLIEDFSHLVKTKFKQAKGKRSKKKIAYLGLTFLLLLLFCLQLISRGKVDLTLEYKQNATSGTVLFNSPGISDADYYVHRKQEFKITTSDYQNFSSFRFRKIREELANADQALISLNAEPFASSLFHLFESDSKKQNRLLTDLMDNYFINLVEKLELDKNKYTIDLLVSRTAGKEVGTAMEYFSKDDPCVDLFLKKKIMEPLQRSSQVEISFSEFIDDISNNCPHSHTLINIVNQDCKGHSNCSNLYFSRGAFGINSFSEKMLNALSKLLLETLPKLKGYNLMIQVEGYADATPLRSPIPVPDGALVADPGTYLNGKSGRKINSITTNEELSFVRAQNCWKHLLETLTGKAIRLSYTGRGVTTASNNSDENRIVKLTISKCQ